MKDNLLRLWVSIFVLHEVRCLRQNKFVFLLHVLVFLVPFVGLKRRSGAKQWQDLKKKKLKKRNSGTIDFDSLYKSVLYSRKSVFFFFLNLRLRPCPVRFALIPKTAPLLCDLWLDNCAPNEQTVLILLLLLFVYS